MERLPIDDQSMANTDICFGTPLIKLTKKTGENKSVAKWYGMICDLLQEKGPSKFAFPTAFRRSQLSLTTFQRL